MPSFSSIMLVSMPVALAPYPDANACAPDPRAAQSVDDVGRVCGAPLAIDTGARKAETLGLKWEDFDDSRGTLRIERQLDAGGAKPEFGPVKTKQVRTVRLAETTVARLRDHRKAQNEQKMKNRTHYADLGLIFAMEYDHLTKGSDRLGHPLRRAVVDRKLAQLLRSVGAPG